MFFFFFLIFYIYQSLLKLKTCHARFSFLLTIGLSDPQGVLSLLFSYICLCFQKINPSQLALFPSLLTIGFYSHPTMSTLPNLHYLHSIYQYLKAYIKAYLKAFVRRIWNHPSRTTPNPPPVNLQLWYGYIYPQLPKQYPIWAVLHEYFYSYPDLHQSDASNHHCFVTVLTGWESYLNCRRVRSVDP